MAHAILLNRAISFSGMAHTAMPFGNSDSFNHNVIILWAQSLRYTTPSLFHPNFAVFPLKEIADVVSSRTEDPKLIIRIINF